MTFGAETGPASGAATASALAQSAIRAPRSAQRQSAPRTPHSAPDQAATLRQWFGQRGPRLLPVLLAEGGSAARATWMARLAQQIARNGERTLAVDGVRAQLAAALGLRARYDLAHVLEGECVVSAAQLDAGNRLAVLPAARALARRQGTTGLLRQLSAGSHDEFDLVLALLPAAALAHLPDGDVLVPVLADAQELMALHASLQAADRALAQRPQAPVTGRFRLLFLGMGPDPASRLAQRLAHKIRMSGAMSLEIAGSARVARDLAQVVCASAGWNLARLQLAFTE